MKENSWLNTGTLTSMGTNTVLGSPKGWLQRAVGANQAELGLHPTSLDPRQITVAGIWLRGDALPDTGSWPALYRYFKIAPDLGRPGRQPDHQLQSVTGMAVAVPLDQVLQVLREFKTRAKWVWFTTGTPAARRSSNLQSVRDLDYQDIYALFDQNMTIREVSDQLRVSPQGLLYVFRRWQQGLPPQRQRRPATDREQVRRDLQAGMTVTQVADRHNISRTMIYKIRDHKK